MRIGNKIFPYPIINSQKNLSAYKMSNFELHTEVEHTDQKYILRNIHYSLNNEQIIKLIKEGFISVYCLVECSATIFREIYLITDKPKDIEIDITNLRDAVTISTFGVAKNKIIDFSDPDFLEDFQGYSFDIDTHDIMLADDGFKFNVDYDELKDNKISSIFNVVRDDNINDETIVIQSNDRKINIFMPSTQYERYNSLKSIEYFKNIFFSMLLIPALISELNKVKNQFNGQNVELDDIETEFKWFRSISKQYKIIYNEDLTLESFIDADLVSLSQKLINMPITKGLDEIYNLRDEGAEDEDD